MKTWIRNMVTDKQNFERNALTAATLARNNNKLPTLNSLKNILKWKMGVDRYNSTIESEGNERKATLEKIWNDIKNTPDPSPTYFPNMNLSDLSDTNTIENMRLLAREGFIPTVKDLRVILKWKIGEAALKEKIDEGRSTNKSVYKKNLV